MIARAIGAVRNRWFRVVRKYADEDRILIYQMGKVGSTSLGRALGDRGIQIHNFYPSNEPWPRLPTYGLGLARKLAHAIFYRAIRRGVRKRRTLKVITLVRDPIARNISMYFQDIHYWLAHYHTERRPNIGRRDDIDVVSDCFREMFDHRYPLEWFDRELKRVTGVDVYDYTFDRNTGCSRVETGTTSILIIQAERLSENWSQVEAFCGSKLEWREDNRAARKWYGPSYDAFLARFSMSAEELDEVYSSRYATFFYSEESLAGFRRRWQRTQTVAPSSQKVD